MKRSSFAAPRRGCPGRGAWLRGDDNRGLSGLFSAVILLMVFIFTLAVFLRVAPIFSLKNNLDIYAHELMRTAEFAGEVGAATTAMNANLRSALNITPVVTWSRSGKVPLGADISVTLTTTYQLPLIGEGLLPIKLTAKAIGKSEVYHKGL